MEFMNLHEKLSALAYRMPDKTAIEYGNRFITYAELDEKSNQVANLLYTQVRGNKNVPILMDRCPELIEAVYGILKAGCLFVPLDAHIPENRLKVMMEECHAEWIITLPAWLPKLDRIAAELPSKIRVLIFDGQEVDTAQYRNLEIGAFDFSALPRSCTFTGLQPNKHCYIYFTTGSTGKPKGIVGRHRSLSHFIQWEIGEFKIAADFRTGQLIAPSFGPYKRDIFAPLSAGATLCIPESNDILLDAERLVAWLTHNRVQLIHTVPALFKSMTLGVRDDRALAFMKYILISGEVLRGNDIREFIRIFKDRIQIVNLYGQTESTLAKLFYRVKPEDVNRAIIPAGKPIDYAEMLILDSAQQRSRVGTVGEIYVRTPFISAGYYNDPELTRKVFIRNPFSDNPQDIVYKTGDLGRVLPDGNIEICGRADHQVKIRGMKVQLKEIENLLLSYKSIKEAVVVDRENKEEERYLCAYIVTNSDVTVTELREFLLKELPDYMVPSYFIKMENLPLTSNGKINRRELPEPSGSLHTGVEYVAPEGKTEERLVEIWEEILGIKKIGVNDNFFHIGGHSLRATTLMARLHKEFSAQIPLRQIFTMPTIRQIAQYLENRSRGKFTFTRVGAEAGSLNTLADVTDRDYNNLPAARRLEGIAPFNSIYFKNCFYNALFPVLTCSGREYTGFLVNEVFTHNYTNTAYAMNLDVEFNEAVPEIELFRELGISIKTKMKCPGILAQVMHGLACNKFVIVRIDCFYESIRKDMFNTTHWPHNLLIYGYDRAAEEFTVLEHNFANSLTYAERRLSFADLKNSYEGFLKNFSDECDDPSYIELSVDEEADPVVRTTENYAKLFAENRLLYRPLLSESLEKLKHFTAELACTSAAKLKPLFETLSFGFNNILDARRAERHLVNVILPGDAALAELADSIARDWDLIRSISDKIKYSEKVSEKSFGNLINKLTKVQEQEALFNEKIYALYDSTFESREVV